MSDLIIAGQQAAADRATDYDTVAALQQAMGVISSVCDYAQELDARGFSAADAWLGHVLAQMSPGLWSDAVALTAWDMLRKYRGQLAAAGIDYDNLTRPAGADEVEAGRSEQAREHARGHARQWKEQQYRQAHTYLRCDGDGEQVILAFPYDPDLVAGCRTIEGRQYDGASKTNVFPFTSLPAVAELTARHGIEVTADVRALTAIAVGRDAEHAAQPQVRLDERDATIIIDASLNPALYDRVKELDGRWDRAARVHRVPGHHAPALADLAGQHGLRISDQVRQYAADISARHEENRAAADVFEADPVPVPGLAAGLALKAQQYPVVRFALDHRQVLIGDDMGWGKTASSLAAVAADGAYPVVVVCRPSLTLNWAGEICRFFPALTVHEAIGTTPSPVPPGTDVVIIGSAALAAKPRKTGEGGKEFGWVEELKKAGPKALIIDEGQDTKERGANRSQACEQLAASVIAQDGLVLDLTGTAILNRPRELCQQLTILGRIGEFGGPKAFLWRYCLSETSQWGASYDGARNLIELHERLRSWGIMIRRSDDAALGLPPCREQVLRIPQAGLDPAVMTRYRQAEADLLGFLAEKARQTAAELGKDPDSAAVEAAMRASSAEHLVAINTLRQLAGQAKRGYITGWVREHVAGGEKVMVAAHHREEVDAYAAEFGGLKLQGGQTVQEKETAKSAFQELPAVIAPVISVAIGAGGVGHTLTAARIGIQAEQAWTPGETQQMKKRLHRIGQDRPVDYYITVAESTIDEHLWAVVTAKQATLNAVLDGRSDSCTAADERSVAAELTWRLTQQGLGTRTGDEASQNHAGLQAPAAPRPDRDAGSGHAIRASSSAEQLPTAGERETSPPAVSAWIAADHGSLDRPVRPVTHRVLLTGSRAWADEQVIADALREHWHDGNALLVTGACPRGADAIAERIWRSRGGLVERHPADWQTGRDAGMRRNAAMVALGADVCLAFIQDGSPGATHAAQLAGQAGVPVHRFEASTGDAVKPGTEEHAAPGHQGGPEAGRPDTVMVRLADGETRTAPVSYDASDGGSYASRAVPAGDHPADEDTASAVRVPARPIDAEAPAQPPARDEQDHHDTPVAAGQSAARVGARAAPGSRGGVPAAPAAPALPGTCNVPRCGEPGRLYPAGIFCDTHRPGPAAPRPETCPQCGRALPAHAPACTSHITGQHLREAANRFESGSEGRATTIASTLDEAVLAAMRADAEAKASPFIDPALLRKAEVVLTGIDAGWLERVVGHPVPSWRYLNHAEMLLAVRATETDAEHLGALAEVERTKLAQQRQTAAASAQAKARAAAAQWQRLREQLPVPVAVQHNWTARHLDGYEQGADHIVVLEDLEAGRLRRAAGTPLCQTPSRAHQQRHVSGSVGDQRRLPDCKACLHYAKKLAASPDASDAGEPGTDSHASTPPATIRREPTRSGLPGGPPRSGTSDRGGDDGQPGTPPVPDADGDGDDDEVSARAQVTGQQLCEAAHRYLDDGLLPVPAWAARQNGECCCPRGADCDRPGKHPRSVHSGPGPRDYSWKPLACRTRAEIDQRFGPGGQYAAGNLMVAIPAGMMAIDRDDDDGGRVALAALNGELGELPPTLSHRTPHGEHLIYRTPENWKGRAWVGKDPANPVPPGIDLRMPGQILMAAPSAVPGPDGPVRYGPVTGGRVAVLPTAYVTAWTPPTAQPRPAAHRVPVPPDSADRAAKYVHDAMARIADDLASRKPGGRNAAAYAAGLKAGSLLGAARATPGAGQAAAAWTDEEAEQALMDAAARNGYTGKDGEAEARRAIRSGFRNGLRSPRALPDFTTSRPALARQQPQHRPAPSGPARPQRDQAAAAPGRRAGRWQDMVPGDIRREIEAADTAASDRRRVAIAAHQQALERHGQSATADTAAEVERTRAVAHAAHQAYTHDGRHVTGRHDAAMLRWAATIAAQREHAAAPPSPGPADSTRAQANRAAVAANEAYRAGDLDRARQFSDRAAALDPSRAELWQQHRQQIAARRLILDAKAAHAEGDRQRAQALLGDARQLDPRMPAIWDGDLPALPHARLAGQTRAFDVAAPGSGGNAGASEATGQEAGPGHRPTGTPGPANGEVPKPQWPSSPARSEPRPAPAAAQRADNVQPPPTATPREPRRHVNAARDDPDPAAEPVTREQPARWPAPSPRAGDAMPPGQQARHEITARQEPAGRQQPRAAAETEPGGNTSPERPGALSADWRDQVLSEARQPWQPAPGWPHNPALRRPPEAGNPGAGIELSEPDA